MVNMIFLIRWIDNMMMNLTINAKTISFRVTEIIIKVTAIIENKMKVHIRCKIWSLNLTYHA